MMAFGLDDCSALHSVVASRPRSLFGDIAGAIFDEHLIGTTVFRCYFSLCRLEREEEEEVGSEWCGCNCC